MPLFNKTKRRSKTSQDFPMKSLSRSVSMGTINLNANDPNKISERMPGILGGHLAPFKDLRYLTEKKVQDDTTLLLSYECEIYQPMPKIEELLKPYSDKKKRHLTTGSDSLLLDPVWCDLHVYKVGEMHKIVAIKKHGKKEVFLDVILSDDLTYEVQNPLWHIIRRPKRGEHCAVIIQFETDSGASFKDFYLQLVEILKEAESICNLVLKINEKSNANFLQKMTGEDSSGSKATANEMPMEVVHNLVVNLKQMIQNGNVKMAEHYAGRLAVMKVKLSISEDPYQPDVSAVDEEISVRVHVEDRFSPGAPINISIHPKATIAQLKKKMEINYRFPCAVQKWIIGKRIPPDTDTLSKCGVNSPGYSLYLYLVSAKSVGLRQKDFDRKYMEETVQKIWTPMPGSKVGPPENLATSGEYMSMKQLVAPKNGGLSPKTKQPEAPPKLTNHQSLGNVNPVNKVTPIHRSASASGIGAVIESVRNMMTTPESVTEAVLNQVKSHTKKQHNGCPIIRHNKEGWDCPKCTYRNKPSRPGCELCAGPRPEDYVMPADYVLSEEETKFLETQKKQDEKTKEAENKQGGEEPSNEQLALVLELNDQLQAAIREAGVPRSPGPSNSDNNS